MKSKVLSWAVRIAAVLLLAVGTGVLAQGPVPLHFRGLINDYTPQTISGKTVGPWEMHGTWSLDVKGRSGLADFSAAMTMQLSDHAMDVAIANGTVTNGVLTTFDDPETRIPHTHHITMKNATVSNVTGSCPVYLPASYHKRRIHGHWDGHYYRQRWPRSLFEGRYRAIAAAGVRQRRNGRPVFQRHSGVRVPREWPFRRASDPGVVRKSKLTDFEIERR